MMGNARSKSTSLIRIFSVKPPFHPARVPMNVPMSMDINTTAMEAPIEYLVP
jgi:hypothetical protein